MGTGTNAHLTRDEVEQAATALVTAFAATDTGAYFDAFTPEASFIFHGEPVRLATRAAYEILWDSWLDDGWRVISCESTNPMIQLLGEVAVFSHDVETITGTGGSPQTTLERETIVFRKLTDGSTKAVHEHLSPVPAHP